MNKISGWSRGESFGSWSGPENTNMVARFISGFGLAALAATGALLIAAPTIAMPLSTGSNSAGLVPEQAQFLYFDDGPPPPPVYYDPPPPVYYERPRYGYYRPPPPAYYPPPPRYGYRRPPPPPPGMYREGPRRPPPAPQFYTKEQVRAWNQRHGF
jgi:hypothetical protein